MTQQQWNLTDAGNAERFLARHGEKYCHTNVRGWFLWDGKCWVSGAEKQVIKDALDTVRHIHDEIPPGA